MIIQWRRENESFAFPASTSPFVVILHVIPLKSKLKVYIPFLTFPTKEYIYVKGTLTYCKQILTKGHKISISSVLASDYEDSKVIRQLMTLVLHEKTTFSKFHVEKYVKIMFQLLSINLVSYNTLESKKNHIKLTEYILFLFFANGISFLFSQASFFKRHLHFIVPNTISLTCNHCT